MSNVSSFRCVILMAGLVMVGPSSADDEFVGNLEVLPADMSLKDVQKVMHGYTRALGVNCSHCHAPHREKEGWLDYALDDLETKQVARGMMRMTEVINNTLVPKTGRENPIRVECETCHRGHSRPETLLQVMERMVEVGGADSAAAEYGKLREQFYGRAGFDFGEKALVEVATHLHAQDKPTDVVESMFRLNLEYYPESVASHVRLGFLLLESGQKEGALASFEKALEINPRQKWLKKEIEKLKSAE